MSLNTEGRIVPSTQQLHLITKATYTSLLYSGAGNVCYVYQGLFETPKVASYILAWWVVS